MTNNKKLEAIQLIIEGFNALLEAEKEDVKSYDVSLPYIDGNTKAETSKPAPVEKPIEEKKEKLVEKDSQASIPKKKDEKFVSAPEKEEESVSEDLESMTDTELKALARDMGIKIVLGMKRQRILDAVRAKISEENRKVVAENTTKKEETLPEDNLMKQIMEQTSDMTDDEIRETLAEADISEKGGRTALLSKLYEAVKNGVIGLGDDEESATEEDAEDAISEENNTVEEDTPERLKAIEEFEKENREAFEKGELEVGDMKAFLKENFNITLSKKVTPAEVFEAYLEHAVDFIDDEGNTVEDGAYTIKGVPYCCGVPLELEKDKSGHTIAKCSICGESYEIEED